MASRPVDRGFGRRGETKVPFHPVKSGFCRMAEPKMLFHPVKGGFCRMGNAMVRGAGVPKNKNCRKRGGFLQFGAQSRARTGTFLRNTGF